MDTFPEHNFLESIPLPKEEWKRLWNEIIIDRNYRKRLENLEQLFLRGKIANYNKLILFDGPPGTGKSSLAKGFANHIADNAKNILCYRANAEEWRSRFLGEPSRFVAEAFKTIRCATRHANAVILIVDELESIAISRSRTYNVDEPSDVITAVSNLLNQLDRLQDIPNVLMISTTNIKSVVDKAIIDRALLVVPFPLPDSQTRYMIIKNSFHEFSTNLNPKEMNELVELSEGLNGRQLKKIPLLGWLEKEKILFYPSFKNYQEAIQIIKDSNNGNNTNQLV